MASEVIDRQLYNGLIHMIHNPDAQGSSPRYKILDADNKIIEKPKGATTIIGGVIAKDFVGWALDSMEAVLKDKCPNISLEDLAHAKLESTRRRDSGASTGSEAHALVERFLKGNIDQNVVSLASPEATKAYKAFEKWYDKVKPEVIGVEEIIYSKEFKYAGAYDCMLKVDGKVYLCDLKTTNASRKAPKGVYAEYFIQMGAYALAHDEQRLYEEANGGTTLLPVEGLMVISAKKDGKLDIVTEEELGLTLADCKEMFKKVVNLFNFLKYTTDKLGGK